MTRPQIIHDTAGRPAFAVIPWHDYERLTGVEIGAAASDEDLYDRAMTEDGESFPIRVADQLLAGENPVRVYRNYRNLTQHELAAAVGINSVYLSQIETGKRVGSTKTLAALAQALDVSIDDLI